MREGEARLPIEEQVKLNLCRLVEVSILSWRKVEITVDTLPVSVSEPARAIITTADSAALLRRPSQ